MSLQKMELVVLDPNAMEKVGRRLYLASPDGLILYLSGELGAGKTTLVRGFLRAMNFVGTVKSPTYTLVEPYEIAEKKVYHFDFYRLNSPEELEYMGIRDYFHGGAYCLVEWPQKAYPLLPTADLHLGIKMKDNERLLTVDSLSDRGQDVLQKLKSQ
jgi:tRNA threonylcarbamoyladenosine biosynthesis protein TsaE